MLSTLYIHYQEKLDPDTGVTPHTPQSVVSLSMVTHGQQQSENIKWKIPEINDSYISTCASTSMISSSFQGHESPFVQCFQAVYATLPASHFIAIRVIGSQCLFSVTFILLNKISKCKSGDDTVYLEPDGTHREKAQSHT
jgi:hypothetical protein